MSVKDACKTSWLGVVSAIGKLIKARQLLRDPIVWSASHRALSSNVIRPHHQKTLKCWLTTDYKLRKALLPLKKATITPHATWRTASSPLILRRVAQIVEALSARGIIPVNDDNVGPASDEVRAIHIHHGRDHNRTQQRCLAKGGSLASWLPPPCIA
jgi:hypothetical protein